MSRLLLFLALLALLLVATPSTQAQSDDLVQVTVSFVTTSYSVEETDDDDTEEEEDKVTVTVRLSADPERTVVIPIEKANQGGAADSDYSGVPSSVTINSGETSATFDFTAVQDTVDDDFESVRLTFGPGLPTGVTAGPIDETVVFITDDDGLTGIFVAFSEGVHLVAEGGKVTVGLRLVNYQGTATTPGRELVIPITATNQGGASAADYSGVPSSVTFGNNENHKEFRLSATSDGEDDGERVLLSFGAQLPAGVGVWPHPAHANGFQTALVNISDGGEVMVDFQSTRYEAEEGEETTITVVLSAEPGREVVVPITVTNRGGASAADYSGVPPSLTFGSEEDEKEITFETALDGDDDGESVKLGFGMLPAGVSAGRDATAEIWINDGPEVHLGLVQVGIRANPFFEDERWATNVTWQWQRSATEAGAYSDIPGSERGYVVRVHSLAGRLGHVAQSKGHLRLRLRHGEDSAGDCVSARASPTSGV